MNDDLISGKADMDDMTNRQSTGTENVQVGDTINFAFNQNDDIALKLSSPLTDEDWDKVIDVDFEHTNKVLFQTKHGKQVEFVKMPGSPQKYIGDTVNEQAVKFLDLFAKTYCKDKSVTDDLVFRCRECEFSMPDKTCLVKCMKIRLCPDYKDFGSMGDL